jgi:ribose-phosphate pyrophosphokinase
VGPDAESEPWVRALARHAGLPWVVCEKERLSDRRVQIRLPALPAASRAILFDDIASSGITLAACARALRRAGISSVDAAVVHAIFAPGALRRIRTAGIRRIVSCDTISHETNGIATASLFAEALARR